MSRVVKQGKEAVERLTDGLGYAPKNGAVLVDSKDLRVLMEYIKALEDTPKEKYRVILTGEWYSVDMMVEANAGELALLKQIDERSNAGMTEASLSVVPYIEDDPQYLYSTITHL